MSALLKQNVVVVVVAAAVVVGTITESNIPISVVLFWVCLSVEFIRYRFQASTYLICFRPSGVVNFINIL